MAPKDLCESRYPVPQVSTEIGPDPQKGMSRFLSTFIEQLEESDPQLFSQEITSPPPESVPALKMSKEEYIKRQNQVFRDLSSYDSPPAMSEKQREQDMANKELVASLELYLAALDEKVYMSVDNSRQIVGIRDNYLHEQVMKLKANKELVLPQLVKLRSAFYKTWQDLNLLTQQRNDVESELALLRNDHALQLAKSMRLRHATQSLGKKLVAMNEENLELKQKLVGQQDLQARVQELEAENLQLRASMNHETGTSVDDKIKYLYSQLAKLSFADKQQLDTNDPQQTLQACLNLVSLGTSANQSKQTSLLNAFMNQYKARERELNSKIEAFMLENEIVVSRVQNLEKKLNDKEQQIQLMETRNLSMVMMLKNMRAVLETKENEEEQQHLPPPQTAQPMPTIPINHLDLNLLPPDSDYWDPRKGPRGPPVFSNTSLKVPANSDTDSDSTRYYDSDTGENIYDSANL